MQMEVKQVAKIFWIFQFYCLSFAQGQRSPIHKSASACVWETFQANCDQDRVIVIEKALYGRMSSTKCFDLGPTEAPCSADVGLFAEKQCGGRRSCSIKMTNENLKVVPGNCSKYLEKSLKIDYRCEDVYSAENSSCDSGQPLIVQSSSGYLANIVTDESRKGSPSCPWKFQPRPDQTVHLTLLDFGIWEDRGERERRNTGKHSCRIYATIKYTGSTHRTPDTPICAGTQQTRDILTIGTAIEIAVNRQEAPIVTEFLYFLIKFQIFDCPEFTAPIGTVTEKSGSGIRVYCPGNQQEAWIVQCQAGHWTPRLNVTCPQTTDSSSNTPPAGTCSTYNPPQNARFTSINHQSGRVDCQNGEHFVVTCVSGIWIPEANKTCTSTQETKSNDNSMPSVRELALYTVPAVLVMLVILAVILVVKMCNKRGRKKEKEMCDMVSPTTDNNSYLTPRELHEARQSCRPTSDVYDSLDESQMLETEACGSAQPFACSPSFSGACQRNAMSLPRSEKHGPPPRTMTLPPPEKQAPLPRTSCGSQRRSDTLPHHRPLPEAHEYTTSLSPPVSRDSTYLIPREQPYDEHQYDTVPSRDRKVFAISEQDNPI